MVTLVTLCFLRVKTIATDQRELFQLVLSSLTCILRKFLRGHLTQYCSKQNTLNHEIPTIELPEKGMCTLFLYSRDSKFKSSFHINNRSKRTKLTIYFWFSCAYLKSRHHQIKRVVNTRIII